MASTLIPAWRLHPKKSFSDWTIIITSKEPSNADGYGSSCEEDDSGMETQGELVSDTYHVHKPFMADGPRGSNYFKRLFMNTTVGLQETETSTSRIELERSEANAFPAMLDFMYTMHTVDVAATTENAAALRHLASYFDIPTLLDNINEFIQKDMNGDNIHLYAKEANLFQDEEMIQDTMKCAAGEWYELLAASDDDDDDDDDSSDDDDDDVYDIPLTLSNYLAHLSESRKNELLTHSLRRKVHELKKELEECQSTSNDREKELNTYRPLSYSQKEEIFHYYDMAVIPNGGDYSQLFYKAEEDLLYPEYY